MIAAARLTPVSHTPAARGTLAVATRHREMRYLLVGGLNTGLCLALFAVFYWSFGGDVGYMGALVLAYSVGIVTGFVAHRFLVFQVQGRLLGDFVRFTMVNLGGFGLNAGLLPLLVEVGRVPAVPAQVLALGCTVVTTYFGHALFSFKRT